MSSITHVLLPIAHNKAVSTVAIAAFATSTIITCIVHYLKRRRLHARAHTYTSLTLTDKKDSPDMAAIAVPTAHDPVPPFAWQAEAGMVPPVPPPPYMYGMQQSMMPWGMQAGEHTQPSPQYLPPGPMPYGGMGGGFGSGGLGGYGGFGMPGMLGQGTWGPDGFTPFDPVRATAPPGITASGPKGYCYINLTTLTGSARSQKAQFLSILSGDSSFDFETHAYPVTDNVIEFLTKIGGNKERYRATEIREVGDGTWQRGISVKYKDEAGWFKRLEGLGWGRKRGSHQGRPVWVVLWKKPEEA